MRRACVHNVVFEGVVDVKWMLAHRPFERFLMACMA